MQAELIKAGTTLIVGLALAYFGLRIYFRQREYELVKQRYLEQSLDIIAGDLEAISSAFSHNWARCLDILREYRDAPGTFEQAQLSRGFLDLGSFKFNRIAHLRLQALTGSDVFWNAYQLALSRHMALNSLVVIEVPHAIRAQLNGKLQATSDEVVAEAMKELEHLTEKSDHFATLQNALHNLSALLERESLSFKRVAEFAKKPRVVVLIKQVGDFYANALKDLVPAP